MLYNKIICVRVCILKGNENEKERFDLSYKKKYAKIE